MYIDYCKMLESSEYRKAKGERKERRMKLFEAITRLMNEPAWSVKIYRNSDTTKALIMDFTGSFLLGPTSSRKKDDYNKQFMLAKHLIEASNWEEFEDNCTWDE